MNTQVKAGYKLTEVGVIPDDWAVTKLSRYVTFKTGPFGSTLHKSDYVDGGVPVINPMQIISGKLCAVESSARDEGRPFALGLQEQGANHRKRRWSKALVVSITEKSS